MSTGVADNLIVAITLGLIATAVWLTCRAYRVVKTAERDDVGPDTLRLLREADAHLDEYVLADPELCARFDPKILAGLDRLRRELHNDQHEGD